MIAYIQKELGPDKVCRKTFDHIVEFPLDTLDFGSDFNRVENACEILSLFGSSSQGKILDLDILSLAAHLKTKQSAVSLLFTG